MNSSHKIYTNAPINRVYKCFSHNSTFNAIGHTHSKYRRKTILANTNYNGMQVHVCNNLSLSYAYTYYIGYRNNIWNIYRGPNLAKNII